MRARGAGTAAAMPSAVNASGAPPARRCIAMASGLRLAARWSPSTPFSAATKGSRPGHDEGSFSSGASGASAVSMPAPTSRVTARTLRYTSPVMPFVRANVASPAMPGRRAML